MIKNETKQRWQALKRRWGLLILILAIAAVLLTVILEYRYFLNVWTDTWGFVTGRPLVFWFTVLLAFLTLGLFTALTRCPLATVGVLLAVILIIGYVHANKFAFRATPLLPEDFLLTENTEALTQFVSLMSLAKLAVTVLLVLAVSVLLEKKLHRRFFPKPQEGLVWWRRWNVIPRSLIVLCSFLMLLQLTDFVRNNNGQRYEKVAWLNTTLTAWNQTRNYDENGFVLGFLYNLKKLNLKAPDGYNQTAVEEIAQKYHKKKQQKAKQRSKLSDADYNIVVVLNESFYDPETITEYYPHNGGDVIPNLHRIATQHPSGIMYSLDFGGGTANIEFEVLTGLTNYWTSVVPYTSLLPRVKEMPSIASFAKQNGYETTAIHPFNGGMYKRNLVLPKEGFDKFITESEMKHQEKEGANAQYINDRAAYQETLDVLKQSKKKQMVMLITMQNHTPYDNIYPKLDYKLKKSLGDSERQQQIESYYQSLHNSDAYLGELVDELDKMQEKTVLLFFGDHSAGMFWELNDAEDAEVFKLSRQTPYFIYSNFKLAKAEIKLPTTSPNCLANTLYNNLNVDKPALSYLLDEVCKETPILASTYWKDTTPKESRALDNYRLVTHDLLGGQQYWLQH